MTKKMEITETIKKVKKPRIKKADLPALPCKKCYIGIDLSLQSPGIAVLETKDNKWQLFGFHQHIHKYHDIHHKMIKLFPMIPSASETNNNERYKFVTDHILEIVKTYQSKYPNPNDMHVAIEGYAFKKNSAHASKLKELGGLMKYRLYFEHKITCEILPPTKWKKYGTGKGVRSKLETGQFLRQETGIDLFAIFDTEEKEKVDNPVEDMYDSMGIVRASKFIHEYPHLIKDSRTKKQKLKDELKKLKLEAKIERAQEKLEKISTKKDKDNKFTQKIPKKQSKISQDIVLVETELKKQKKAIVKKQSIKKMVPVPSIVERKHKLEILLNEKQKKKRKKITPMEDEFQI